MMNAKEARHIPNRLINTIVVTLHEKKIYWKCKFLKRSYIRQSLCNFGQKVGGRLPV